MSVSGKQSRTQFNDSLNPVSSSNACSFVFDVSFMISEPQTPRCDSEGGKNGRKMAQNDKCVACSVMSRIFIIKSLYSSRSTLQSRGYMTFPQTLAASQESRSPGRQVVCGPRQKRRHKAVAHVRVARARRSAYGRLSHHSSHCPKSQAFVWVSLTDSQWRQHSSHLSHKHDLLQLCRISFSTPSTREMAGLRMSIVVSATAFLLGKWCHWLGKLLRA